MTTQSPEDAEEQTIRGIVDDLLAVRLPGEIAAARILGEFINPVAGRLYAYVAGVRAVQREAFERHADQVAALERELAIKREQAEGLKAGLFAGHATREALQRGVSSLAGRVVDVEAALRDVRRIIDDDQEGARAEAVALIDDVIGTPAPSHGYTT